MMTVYLIPTAVLVALLAVTTTVAFYLGLANWIGAFYVVRCAACHHLTFNSRNAPQASCPQCRHPVLTHPLHALTHPADRSNVRVAGDHLHY